MTKADQMKLMELVGNLGVATINSDDGMLKNFRLDIDTYDDKGNSLVIASLDDAEFVIPIDDDTLINDNIIRCKGYEIEIV